MSTTIKPNPLGIGQIKSKLLNPALTSLYQVTVGLPSKNTDEFRGYLTANGVRYDQEKLNLLCCEATLPGSNLATLELNNDRTGVTERHAYRRVYDDRIDLTFYVDTQNYMPIRFFETWIKYIAQESIATSEGNIKPSSESSNYFYSFKYPDEYVSEQGLSITKFEKSSLGAGGFQSGGANSSGEPGGLMTYTFIRSFPISISSMPVSYDTSSLLKCTVSMTYIRYVVNIGTNDSFNNEGSVTNQTVGSPDSPWNLSFEEASKLNLGNAYNFKYDTNYDFFKPGTQALFNGSQAFNAGVGLPASGAGTNAFLPNPSISLSEGFRPLR